MNHHMMKYKTFKLIHDNPVEVYGMWTILVLTILLLVAHVYLRLTDYSETYQFINNL
jgi:hypothetical protein